MGLIYLNDDDYIRIRQKAKENKIPTAQMLKSELHKPIEVKEIIKEIPKEIKQYYYWEKLAGDKKARWHQYKFEGDKPILID